MSIPYIQEYRDKNGKLRRYVRRKGYARIPITARKGTKEFAEQYKAALDGLEPPAKKQDANGFIYFADDGHFVKIGFATNVSARIQDLQIGSTRAIQLLGTKPGTMADERRLHRQFAHLRHRGEWFKKEAELLEAAGVQTTNSWSDA
jgi:hypothetical protein